MPQDKYSNEYANVISQNIERANDYYKKWADKFQVDTCEKYYEGDQWLVTGAYSPYTINMVFSTIEVKLPSLVFNKPVCVVKPKPGKYSFDPAAASEGAVLKQDILNTWITDSDNSFVDEIELSITDVFFRFGVVEVGYSGNWVENPNADKPLLKSDKSSYMDGNGEVIKQPARLPLSEWNYVKRICPWRFRVGGLDSYKLKRCNWVGYYEFVRLEDLKSNKTLKNTDQISIYNAAARSEEFIEQDEKMEERAQGDLAKIWHIWDMRSKERILYNETTHCIHLNKPFLRLPIFPLVFHRRSQGFYPLPPVFNWLSMQNELNETREMQRVHRRRFIRKYFYNKNILTDEQEIDKLINGPDGTFSGVDGDPNAVAAPLHNAPLDAVTAQSMIVSRDDFNIVSGTSAEQRGVGGSNTATEATIINNRALVRENRASKQVTQWLTEILKEVILQMKENNMIPYWILKTQSGQKDTWEQFLLSELDDFDFDVTIDVAQMSPVAEENQKKSLFEFLAILSNYPHIAMEPELIREVAYVIGYRNEKVIEKLMNIATLNMIGQIEAGKQQMQGSAMGQRQTAKSTPDTMEKITNQIKNQNGLMGG